MKGVVFGAVFTVEVYDDDRLVQRVVRHNRILRVGLFAIVSRGIFPSQFSTFTVGSGIFPESSALLGLYTPYVDGYKLGTYVPMPFPQWGFTATYGAGVATGAWTEIGMCFAAGDTTLNRALFADVNGNLTPVNKAFNFTATVNVAFTMSRN